MEEQTSKLDEVTELMTRLQQKLDGIEQESIGYANQQLVGCMRHAIGLFDNPDANIEDDVMSGIKEAQEALEAAYYEALGFHYDWTEWVEDYPGLPGKYLVREVYRSNGSFAEISVYLLEDDPEKDTPTKHHLFTSPSVMSRQLIMVQIALILADRLESFTSESSDEPIGSEELLDELEKGTKIGVTEDLDLANRRQQASEERPW